MSRPRIAVVCPYPVDRAPSQRLKYEQYFDDWRAWGWEVEVHSFWDAAAWEVLYRRGALPAKIAAFARGLRRRRRDFDHVASADLVYLHLGAVPLGPPRYERRLKAAGARLVYDIDDLVHLPHASRANPFVRLLRGGAGILERMEIADHVVTCTPALRDLALRHNPRVTDISSTIDTDAYRPRPHRPRTRGVVVGWSGSHSTSPYLHLLDDVLRELVRSDDVRVRVIGDADFAVPGLPPDRLTALPWRRQSEVADLSEIDIGVYPLPDEPWVLGKSGLKALQYMALEIPTVAQRIGTNPTIIRDGGNGLLAGEPGEWLQALRRLVRDPELRRTLGHAGRRTVEERYSLRATAPVYRSVLRDVAGASAPPETAPDGA